MYVRMGVNVFYLLFYYSEKADNKYTLNMYFNDDVAQGQRGKIQKGKISRRALCFVKHSLKAGTLSHARNLLPGAGREPALKSIP